MKDWLRDCLVDPVEREPLSFAGDRLVARNGAHYPIVEGIPVLLRMDLPPTHRGAMRTDKLADVARQGFPSTWSPPSTFAMSRRSKSAARSRPAAMPPRR